MQTSSNGPWTTLLMFVPLLLVPLLAILGIPQLDPTAPAADAASEGFFFGADDAPDPADPRDRFAPVREDRPGAERFLSDAPAGGETWDDPFDAPPSNAANAEPPRRVRPDPDDAEWGTQSASEPSRERPAPLRDTDRDDFLADGPRDRDTTPTDERPPTGLPRDEFARTTDDQATRPAQPDAPSTWRAAVERLNELGIRHFQLEPGARENEFLFSCVFTPKDNPRITRRFEAEASDPLRAVQKVIEQVETWRKQQR